VRVTRHTTLVVVLAVAALAVACGSKPSPTSPSCSKHGCLPETSCTEILTLPSSVTGYFRWVGRYHRRVGRYLRQVSRYLRSVARYPRPVPRYLRSVAGRPR
jgi:hypothetical protein